MHDHRKLGRELNLFDTDPLMGAGLPYWLPDGAVLRHTLEEFVRDAERRAGYRHVYSPVLGKRELYEISGHWDHYSEDMFPPMGLGGEQVVLRPSLCPHHALIYRSRAHSYRELPLRLAELGGMYRSELSGVLGGLTRVRAIQLNDGHVFCTLDQVADEARAALELIGRAYDTLGVRVARYRLSLPGEGGKYVADPGMWRRASLQYVGADGSQHRPVMVHRAVIGSMERAVAHLIELYGGAFPAWLAPVQVVALPVSKAEVGEAEEFVRRCVERGLRAEARGPEHGTLGARVRSARLVPYQAVIGPREATDGLVALRLRDGRRLDPLPAGEALGRIKGVVVSRRGELWG
ncbi:threonine--tRNA ligase [Streptomyces cinnamoneus]|uniref:threonine--tRNA ligase n=1 Tax=Streptomyces cinnamoneus TaxID=53446 RepID=A0A2G1XK82_STRCJ|nr:aminoacyl--tRNA ligase-related protein [Streptomyces cinnamoneus]PHQ51645.1 threonine--tRNA ligase [Streptomyces cinnamoneus]PPT14431.1 threonine--tRNA ligase [Streptomyces cinnamoneus]